MWPTVISLYCILVYLPLYTSINSINSIIALYIVTLSVVRYKPITSIHLLESVDVDHVGAGQMK